MYYGLIDSRDIYNFTTNYYGITQDPITEDFIIIMDYYQTGDLTHYITKECYKTSWVTKLHQLKVIAKGLNDIHKKGFIHHDFHSGNILIKKIVTEERQN